MKATPGRSRRPRNPADYACCVPHNARSATASANPANPAKSAKSAKPANSAREVAAAATRWPLVAASVVVAVEAAALAASAISVAVLILSGHHTHDRLDAWLVVGLAAICAVGLWWVWRGLVRRRRWARSPAVLVQLLALPVSYNAFGDGAWWLATPLLVCAVVGLVGLLAPSTTEVLIDGHSSTSKPSRN